MKMTTQIEQSTLGELYNPLRSSAWQPTPLYPLADWINGLAFKDIHFTKAGKPVIKIAEIKNGITGQTQFTDGSYDGNIHIADGDMLFAWSGQPETSIGVSIWRGQDGWLNQHIFKVLPNATVDRDFFFFLLRYLNPYFVRIAKNKQTTGLGHVTKEDLRSMQVGIPPLNEQREIVQILLPLERKIELLRRQNETLEQIAQTIFNEWFLQSGGKKVPLQEVVELNPTTALKKGVKALYFDMGALPTKGSWPEKPIERTFTSGSKFKDGDTLMARITPCLENGKTAFIQCLPENTVAWGSTEFIVMRVKPPLPPVFAYLLARSEGFRDFAIRAMSGTSGRQRVQVDMLSNYEIAMPTEGVVSEFANLTNTFFAKIKNNSIQIGELAALRDTLLPRLMSGEMRIKS